MRSCKCGSLNSAESKKVENLSALLKIVSEESRLKLLCILKQGKYCVCEMMDQVDMSQSLISHHLKDLRDLGLIEDKKRGSYVFYSLTPKGKDITNLLFQIKL